MKVTVWIASALLAAAFVFIGAAKVFASPDQLEVTAQGVPIALLKIAGAAEILGAVGLVLPALTRILPVLTAMAASGLVITMFLATITNVIIGEYTLVSVTVVLGALAAFVAWARLGPVAVAPRRSVVVESRPQRSQPAGARVEEGPR